MRAISYGCSSARIGRTVCGPCDPLPGTPFSRCLCSSKWADCPCRTARLRFVTLRPRRKEVATCALQESRKKCAYIYGANLFRTHILTGDDEILDLPVERDLLGRLKGRVELAREIDRIQHGATKENYDKNWLKVTAEALEIDLSDEE
jgi:hypothetical protein